MKEATVLLSGARYTTLSLMMTAVANLPAAPTEDTKLLVQHLKVNINHRFFEKMYYTLTGMATLLDPRFKKPCLVA